ncbi:low molecular weight protein-tyrosine-phosphatase [Sphingomonas sp. SRS2]|uniref:low molecular weight protein-tyrosine-phosphatase n=1 Tax=Sphingomonas sp. SRS2 TaxID=133190 RepID=UPI000618458F|nr:low molecular weight protein-tyrosine-phosphatase [Sphingomonas sp. SRS2]KKC27881.1 phosphotyrosine protein phosphatase [Sphingomonas sp. SRS2]
MTPAAPPRLLFVCLGNICRSPLAEAAMRAAADRAGLAVEVDSAGTGDWHVGRPPDPRAIATAARYGLDISGLRGRQVSVEDFRRFDHVIALDRSNMAVLRGLQPTDTRAALSMLLDHVDGRHGQDIADPYFGEDERFEVSWRDIGLGVDGLLAMLRAQPSG